MTGPTTGGRFRLRWQAIPLVILGLVAASFLGLEVLGLASLQGTVDQLRDADPASAAVAIFALLVVDGVLPVPSTPLMVLAGTILGTPAGVALTVAGSMISSASTYAIGRFANPWLRRRVVDEAELRRMRRAGDRFGRLLFVLARGIPMMAETVGVCAGIARVPADRFFGWTLLGTVPICLLYVVAGSYAETVEGIVMVTAVGFLAALIAWYALRRVLAAPDNPTEDGSTEG